MYLQFLLMTSLIIWWKRLRESFLVVKKGYKSQVIHIDFVPNFLLNWSKCNYINIKEVGSVGQWLVAGCEAGRCEDGCAGRVPGSCQTGGGVSTGRTSHSHRTMFRSDFMNWSPITAQALAISFSIAFLLAFSRAVCWYKQKKLCRKNWHLTLRNKTWTCWGERKWCKWQLVHFLN